MSPELLNELYRYGLALTCNSDAAFDLVQDAIEVALVRPPDKKNALPSYLRRVMRNRFIDGYRRDQLITFESCDFGAREPLSIDPRSLEQLFIESETVETLLGSLNPLERETLFLWAVVGYTAAEIADFSDCARSTVLSRIQRLRKKVLAQSIPYETNRIEQK